MLLGKYVGRSLANAIGLPLVCLQVIPRAKRKWMAQSWPSLLATAGRTTCQRPMPVDEKVEVVYVWQKQIVDQEKQRYGMPKRHNLLDTTGSQEINESRESRSHSNVAAVAIKGTVRTFPNPSLFIKKWALNTRCPPSSRRPIPGSGQPNAGATDDARVPRRVH